jgi:hypothetical protein
MPVAEHKHLPGALFKFSLWFSLAVDVPHVRGRLAEGDAGGPDSTDSSLSVSEITIELSLVVCLLGENCRSTLLRMILGCLVRALLRRPMTVSTTRSGTSSRCGKENISKSEFNKILLSPFSLLQIKSALVPNNLQTAVNDFYSNIY